MAKSKLPKFTLSYDDKKKKWDLTNDKSDEKIKSFDTKTDALKGGVLEKAVGKDGGSVKIKKEDGKYQEERTYPGSKDPKETKG